MICQGTLSKGIQKFLIGRNQPALPKESQVKTVIDAASLLDGNV
jgi:hypothetical protein